MRTMGLDIGTHTIGIAISDELGITAQKGFKTLRRKSPEGDLKELSTIVHQFEVEEIVGPTSQKHERDIGKTGRDRSQMGRGSKK